MWRFEQFSDASRGNTGALRQVQFRQIRKLCKVHQPLVTDRGVAIDADIF